MPDFEKQISEWRRQMSASGIRTPAVLDELESHIRADVEAQMRAGLNGQQAFKVAVRRIGQAQALKSEFNKAGDMKEARQGKLIGIACCTFACLFSLLMTPGLLTIHELTVAQRICGLAAVALTVLSIVSWRFSHKYLPVIRNRPVRMAVGVACGLMGVIWLFAFIGKLLPDFVLDGVASGELESILRVILLIPWAMALTAVLGSIAYGLEEAARRQTTTVNL